MALSIKISSFVSGGFTGDLIRWILKEDVTGAQIDTHEEPGPHGQVYNFSWSYNIRDIIYRIEMYDVPPGGGVGNLIKSHVVSVTTSTIIMDADIEVIVGGAEVYDPAAGQDTMVVPALIGRPDDSFYLMQRGVGQLLYQRAPEYTFDTVTGTIVLQGGALFNDEDVWMIKMRPTVVINPPGSSGGAGYKNVIELTADTALTGANFGMLIICNSLLPVMTLTLPDIADIPEKLPMFIESVGVRADEADTNHINCVIQALVGNTITGLGKTKTRFCLTRGERAGLIKLGTAPGKLYFFTDSIDAKRRGQLEFGYAKTMNRLWADGSEYAIADYPSLEDAMNEMQMGTVISYAEWNNVVGGIAINKGKFALSDDGTMFKVPDLRNKSIRFMKNSDGTNDAAYLSQGPGGYQDEMVGSHRHFVANTDSINPFTGIDANNFLVYQNDAGPGDFKYRLGGSATEPNAAKTSTGGGTEQRLKAYSQIPLIII